MIWRNDYKDVRNDIIYCAADDRVLISRDFHLNIIHVQATNGRGFLPSIIDRLINPVIQDGNISWITTDDDHCAYNTAFAHGHDLLGQHQSIHDVYQQEYDFNRGGARGDNYSLLG